MDKTSLEKNLANMERELIALQTAHEIGLGSVIYWEYSGSYPAVYQTDILYIKIWTLDGERPDAIMNFYSDGDLAGLSILVKSLTYPNRYLAAAFSFDPGTPIINWKLISTSKVGYGQLETIEEAEEWLGEY